MLGYLQYILLVTQNYLELAQEHRFICTDQSDCVGSLMSPMYSFLSSDFNETL